ncbi:MAG: MarR family winged helix-turn-helix transcriptional regulator [Gemmatimonadota bacterium]
MSDLQSVLHAWQRIESVCGRRKNPDRSAGVRVSANQAEILGYLHPTDPVMVTELAEFLGVTASTMSLTLKRMEAAGWIRRDRDPADRRVVNVRLTEEGAALAARRSSLSPDCMDAALLLLAPHERREVVRGMSHLARAADRLARVNDGSA